MKFSRSKPLRKLFRSRKANDEMSMTASSKVPNDNHSSEELEETSVTSTAKESGLVQNDQGAFTAAKEKETGANTRTTDLKKLELGNVQGLMRFIIICASLWILLKASVFVLMLGPPLKKLTAPWLCVKFQLLLSLVCCVYGFSQTNHCRSLVERMMASDNNKFVGMGVWDMVLCNAVVLGTWITFRLLYAAVQLAPMMVPEESLLCLLLTVFELSFIGLGLVWIFSHKLAKNISNNMFLGGEEQGSVQPNNDGEEPNNEDPRKGEAVGTLAV